MNGEDPLPQYSTVEVVELRRMPEDYDGWKLNKRPPAVGDRGVIVDRLGVDAYVVECLGQDGVSVWLADLERRELRPVADPS